ncbi:MAG: fibronectin type III domain-containing protein [Candidatus Micrarchaeota archaeon]|nr:fibronectin type III domain-containing protein [Candidatus Micrarchaeota archaeon]
MKILWILFLIPFLMYGSVVYCNDYIECKNAIQDPNIITVFMNNTYIFFNGSSSSIQVPSNKVIDCRQALLVGNPRPAFLVLNEVENITLRNCMFFYDYIDGNTSASPQDVVRINGSRNITILNFTRAGYLYPEPYRDRYDGLYGFRFLIQNSRDIHIERMHFNFDLDIINVSNLNLDNKRLSIAGININRSKNLLVKHVYGNGIRSISESINITSIDVGWSYLSGLIITNSKDLKFYNYFSAISMDTARGLIISNSSDIEFDGLDLRTRTFQENGTLIRDSENISIRNTLYGNSFSRVIVIERSKNITIQNLSMKDIFEQSFVISNSDTVKLRDINLMFSYYRGLHIENSTNVTLQGANIEIYSEPIRGVRVMDVLMTEMKIKSLVGYIIELINANNISIFNNILNVRNATTNFLSLLNISNLYLNRSPTPGTNIVNRSYIAGNYWTNQDENGYSDTCTDGNGDFICDNPYVVANISGDEYTDYAPLTGRENVPPQIRAAISSNPYIYGIYIPYNYSDGTALQSAAIYLNQILLRTDPVYGLGFYSDAINLSFVSAGNHTIDFLAMDIFNNSAYLNASVEVLTPVYSYLIPGYSRQANVTFNYSVRNLSSVLEIYGNIVLYEGSAVLLNHSHVFANGSMYMMIVDYNFSRSGNYTYEIINRYVNSGNNYTHIHSNWIMVDSVAPDVNVTNPGNFVTSSSVNVPVNFSLWDDFRLSYREIYLNGSLVNNASVSVNGTYTYTFTNLGPGVYTVRVVVYDTLNNSDSS